MDYYTQPDLNILTMPGAERRKSLRKRLHRRVSVGQSQGTNMQGHTVEISNGGLALLLPSALASGEVCAIRFDMPVNGEMLRIAGVGTVVNCSLSGFDGFRVGMRFAVRDQRAIQAINEYLQ